MGNRDVWDGIEDAMRREVVDVGERKERNAMQRDEEKFASGFVVSAEEQPRHAREYAAVQVLAESIGYGNLMHLASELWREKGPSGAFTIGPCFGSIRGENLDDLTGCVYDPLDEIANLRALVSELETEVKTLEGARDE